MNKNIVKQYGLCDPGTAGKMNGHRSFNLWFTGLSGSGKSTLAHALKERLHILGCRILSLMVIMSAMADAPI